MLDKISKDDIKNYMVVIIIGIVMVGLASYNIYDNYTEVSEKRIILQKEAVELEKEKLKFYKEQTKREEELDKQKNKFLLLKRNTAEKAQNTIASEKNLNNLSIKYRKCLAEFEEYKNEMKTRDFSATIENKIIKLMDKFSDLGVNLKKPDWCDRNYTKRYDTASSILKQISSLVGNDNYLYKYNTFIQNNKSFFTYGSRECKQHIIKNQ